MWANDDGGCPQIVILLNDAQMTWQSRERNERQRHSNCLLQKKIFLAENNDLHLHPPVQFLPSQLFSCTQRLAVLAVMAVLAVSPGARAATMTTLWTARCIFMKNWEGPAPEVFLPVKWRKIEKLPPQHPPTTSLVARIWHPPCRLLRIWAL